MWVIAISFITNICFVTYSTFINLNSIDLIILELKTLYIFVGMCGLIFSLNSRIRQSTCFVSSALPPSPSPMQRYQKQFSLGRWEGHLIVIACAQSSEMCARENRIKWYQANGIASSKPAFSSLRTWVFSPPFAR